MGSHHHTRQTGKVPYKDGDLMMPSVFAGLVEPVGMHTMAGETLGYACVVAVEESPHCMTHAFHQLQKANASVGLCSSFEKLTGRIIASFRGKFARCETALRSKTGPVPFGHCGQWHSFHDLSHIHSFALLLLEFNGSVQIVACAQIFLQVCPFTRHVNKLMNPTMTGVHNWHQRTTRKRQLAAAVQTLPSKRPGGIII